MRRLVSLVLATALCLSVPSLAMAGTWGSGGMESKPPGGGGSSGQYNPWGGTYHKQQVLYGDSQWYNPDLKRREWDQKGMKPFEAAPNPKNILPNGKAKQGWVYNWLWENNVDPSWNYKNGDPVEFRKPFGRLMQACNLAFQGMPEKARKDARVVAVGFKIAQSVPKGQDKSKITSGNLYMVTSDWKGAGNDNGRMSRAKWLEEIDRAVTGKSLLPGATGSTNILPEVMSGWTVNLTNGTLRYIASEPETEYVNGKLIVKKPERTYIDTMRSRLKALVAPDNKQDRVSPTQQICVTFADDEPPAGYFLVGETEAATQIDGTPTKGRILVGSNTPIVDTFKYEMNMDRVDQPTEEMDAQVTLVSPSGKTVTKKLKVSNRPKGGQVTSPAFTPADFGYKYWSERGDWHFNWLVKHVEGQDGMHQDAVLEGKGIPAETFTVENFGTDKVWADSEAEALKANDPGHTNKVAADNKMFLANQPVSAVVNTKIVKTAMKDINKFTITDDWTKSANLVTFDQTKTKVFVNGKDASDQFTITTNGTKTTATANPAFIESLKTATADMAIKLVLSGVTKPLTADQLTVKIPNGGSVCINEACELANEPVIELVKTPADKVWVKNEAEALSTQDEKHTNKQGVDERVFMPGETISTVVNNTILAATVRGITNYQMTDDYTKSKDLVRFAAKNAKVFANGKDVTAMFTLTDEGTKVVAKSKPEFVEFVKTQTADLKMKLVLNGKFVESLPAGATGGTLPNNGETCTNEACVATNEPKVYLISPPVDKAWVYGQTDALTVFDPKWTNNVGADNATFMDKEPVAVVVNTTIPEAVKASLTGFKLVDDWTKAAKHVDFDQAKTKVFADGKDVTVMFAIETVGTKTTATAKPEFISQVRKMSKDMVMKLVLFGATKSLAANEDHVNIPNNGEACFNESCLPTNEPVIHLVKQAVDKVWVKDQEQALTTEDPKHTNKEGVDEFTFLPGEKVSAVVNDKIAAGRAAMISDYRITDDYTQAAQFANFKALNAKVFADGQDVSDMFSIVDDGTTIVAKAKTSFVKFINAKTADVKIKLVISGEFVGELPKDVNGKATLLNTGKACQNDRCLNANTPKVYLVDPVLDKVWIDNQEAGLTTADPEWTNQVGVDNHTFMPTDDVSTVLNVSVPAGPVYDKFVIEDDWDNVENLIDFNKNHESIQRIFLADTEVTDLFVRKNVENGFQLEAKPEMVEKLNALTQNVTIKVLFTIKIAEGVNITDAMTGKEYLIHNRLKATWNTFTKPGNDPKIRVWLPKTEKLWSADFTDAIKLSDPEWTNNVGSDNKTFKNGDYVHTSVGAVIPDGLSRPLTVRWRPSTGTRPVGRGGLRRARVGSTS